MWTSRFRRPPCEFQHSFAAMIRHINNQPPCKQNIWVIMLLALRSIIAAERVFSVCGDCGPSQRRGFLLHRHSVRAFRGSVVSRSCTRVSPGSKIERWGWQDVAGFLRSPWAPYQQIRRHDSCDLDVASSRLRQRDPASVCSSPWVQGDKQDDRKSQSKNKRSRAREWNAW